MNPIVLPTIVREADKHFLFQFICPSPFHVGEMISYAWTKSFGITI